MEINDINNFVPPGSVYAPWYPALLNFAMRTSGYLRGCVAYAPSRAAYEPVPLGKPIALRLLPFPWPFPAARFERHLGNVPFVALPRTSNHQGS